jgi:hypothetical protein
VETAVNDPDSTSIPRITRNSLSEFGGSPLSHLRLQLAYSKTISQKKQFGHTVDTINGCLILLITKLGGRLHFQGTHINTDFVFGVDRSPICFGTGLSFNLEKVLP